MCVRVFVCENIVSRKHTHFAMCPRIAVYTDTHEAVFQIFTGAAVLTR